MDLLFVYGSLKDCHSAHKLLNFIHRQPDGILDDIELIDHDGYPMLRPGKSSIYGEVYEVSSNNWTDLDEWEEAPMVYTRNRFILRDGRTVWVYVQGS